jgi:bifunctional UDP-N-acetylglucosamine pyrophosphorylase / glucosamine-1-phosphate N-acetyltransferase
VVLAAGMGTRMRSRLAKVLHPLLGRSMAGWVVGAARDAGLSSVVVTHHQEDAVRADLSGPGVVFARQDAPRGTGDAVRSALAALPESGVVVVLCGDAPLVRSETLRALLDAHGQSPFPVTVVTARVVDPAAYGRILRTSDGRVGAIVEAAEATPEQLAIDEINTGLYAFDAGFLRRALPLLRPHPPKNEFYLTDLVQLAEAEGGAGGMLHGDRDELMGVNDRWALTTAEAVLQDRILRRHALSGVTFHSPATTRVEATVALGQDVVVGPGVVLTGETRVGAGTRLGTGSVVADSDIGEDVNVLPYSVFENSTVSESASIGPFARLRPGTVVGASCKVGNFVEIKKSTLEAGAKVSHLSYIGDTRVGARANVGAGTITCNYDGFRKHRTDIGEGAFIGSNSALVAPVVIGDGAIVGAGSVVTKNVAADAIAVARGSQVERSGAAARFRARQTAPAHPPKGDT